MSKRTPMETMQREALINGNGKEAREPRAKSTEFICITERHGQRQMRLSHISQVVKDAGQVGGPWFVRIDGQQLAVSEANARLILGLLGLTMEEAKG